MTAPLTSPSALMTAPDSQEDMGVLIHPMPLVPSPVMGFALPPLHRKKYAFASGLGWSATFNFRFDLSRGQRESAPSRRPRQDARRGTSQCSFPRALLFAQLTGPSPSLVYAGNSPSIGACWTHRIFPDISRSKGGYQVLASSAGSWTSQQVFGG